MTQYVIVYFGGDEPESQEAGQAHFSAYMAWLDSLGSAVVSPANPMRNIHSITRANGTVSHGESGMSGYTIIDVADIETALEMASRCPFLDVNGRLEVAELANMPSRKAEAE